MAAPVEVQLWRTCQDLRDELRDEIGLTTLVIDLHRARKSITVRFGGATGVERPAAEHRYAWVRGDPRRAEPASISIPLRDAGGVIGALTLLDAQRAFYPAAALVDVERIAARYAPAFRSWIEGPEP